MALAYGVQPPGLSVAEFAPSAQRTIEPPPTTAPDVAQAGGATGRRSTTTRPPATVPSTAGRGDTGAAPTTQVARARSCVGVPPRQIDDPLSPPCLATIFEGDNGGSTSRGVSGTEIRVSVPTSAGRSGTTPTHYPAIDALFEYFNARFEFYGRRLVPVRIEGDATTSLNARAHAAEVVSQGVFAALAAGQDWGFPQVSLPQTLGANGVVTIVENLGMWWTDRMMFDALHPYVWSVYPSSEELQRDLAAFSCSTLAGRPARFAGATDLHGKTRRFVVVKVGKEVVPQARVLVDALTECTGQAPLSVDWTELTGSTALRTGFNQLLAAGATTAICVCEGLTGFNTVPGTARAANFFPEWILGPTLWGGLNDDEEVVQDRRVSALMAPPMRLSAGPRLLPIQARPWFQALLAVNPNLATTKPGTYGSVWDNAGLYYDQLLLLASGIQAAGPNLTPATFAAALTDLQFPNPGAGEAPFWQPSAGFGPGDHSFFDDYTIGWWSDGADAMNHPKTTKPKGSWCYVGGGARFKVGTYPTDDQALFDPDVPCRS